MLNANQNLSNFTNAENGGGLVCSLFISIISILFLIISL